MCTFKVTMPGILYNNLLPVSCGDIGFLKRVQVNDWPDSNGRLAHFLKLRQTAIIVCSAAVHIRSSKVESQKVRQTTVLICSVLWHPTTVDWQDSHLRTYHGLF